MSDGYISRVSGPRTEVVTRGPPGDPPGCRPPERPRGRHPPKPKKVENTKPPPMSDGYVSRVSGPRTEVVTRGVAPRSDPVANHHSQQPTYPSTHPPPPPPHPHPPPA